MIVKVLPGYHHWLERWNVPILSLDERDLSSACLPTVKTLLFPSAVLLNTCSNVTSLEVCEDTWELLSSFANLQLKELTVLESLSWDGVHASIGDDVCGHVGEIIS